MARHLASMTCALVAAVAVLACGGTPQPAPPPTSSPAPSATRAAAPVAPNAIRAPLPESADAGANALVLEAREKGRDRSRQGTLAAIKLYEQAVQRDPQFTRAYAELALAYGTLDDATDPLVRRPRAKEAAQKAVALDGASAPAHAALGFVRYRFDWEWAEAEAEFQKALSADANDTFARQQYGIFLATIGRTDDALRELGRALEREPGSPGIQADRVTPLLRAGRVAEARAALDAFAAIAPNGPFVHQLQSDVFAAEGRAAESVDSWLKALTARGVAASRVNELRAAHKAGGQTRMIERRIARLTKELEDGPSPPTSFRLATDLALAHASLKHRDQTMHWLAVAIDLHEDAPLHMQSSPAFDFVREDPQFKELLRRAARAEARALQPYGAPGLQPGGRG